MKNIIRPFLEIAMSLFAAIIFATIFNILGYASSFESILLGLLVFMAVTIVQTQYATTRLLERQEYEQLLGIIQNAIDVKLSNIREAYRKLLKSPKDGPDLFQSIFKGKISELEKSILDAAQRGELQIAPSDFATSRIILGIFDGSASDIIRDVYLFDDNEYFFSVFSKQYFYNVSELVRKGKIHQVRRLLLFSTEDELHDSRSIRLMNFHAVTRGYSYKLMKMEEYQLLMRDYGLDIPRGMTIYGTRYVYHSAMSRPNSIMGIWSNNTSTIESYLSFFETCWTAPFAFELKTTENREILTLDDLFGKTTP